MKMRSLLASFYFLVILVLQASVIRSSPQSNYEVQGNDIEYHEKERLPPSATLGGKLVDLDTIGEEIKLNRTTAHLFCASGVMRAVLSFKEPFYGIAYSDFDRASACYTKGTGMDRINLELPLRGCGTKQDPQRVFTNNIVVRFHPDLELEGDEVVTIVCRYPPPIAEAPPVASPILPPLPITKVPLRELEVLLIICAVMFLGLMLLGLGVSYQCLRHRKLQVYRRARPEEEEIESEQVSTLQSYTPPKVPRIRPPSPESSSEVPLEEFLGSDYPSSIEDQQRPGTVSSEYSDTHVQVETELLPPARIYKPQFDVNLRVAKEPQLTPTRFSELDGSISSLEGSAHARTRVEPDLKPPPRKRAPPPVFSKAQEIREPKRSVQETELVDNLTVIDRQDIETETKFIEPVIVQRKPEVTVQTVDDVYLQTIVERRLIEDEERRIRETTQYFKKDEPKWDVVIRSQQEPIDDAWERGSETTDVASSIGWSVVDESYYSPQVQPRTPHYSTLNSDLLTRRTDINRTNIESITSSTVKTAMEKLQSTDTQTWNEKWQVLLRVLETPSPMPITGAESTITTDDEDDAMSILTEDDREKWRQIITTESNLRSLLTRATVREDYELIRRDTRYEKLFEPDKWDVIIRVLAQPEPSPAVARKPSPQPGQKDFDDDASSIMSSLVIEELTPVPERKAFDSTTTTTTMSTTATGMTSGASASSMVVRSSQLVGTRTGTILRAPPPPPPPRNPGMVGENQAVRTQEFNTSNRVDPETGAIIQESSVRSATLFSSSHVTKY